jgi:hypothetical protein
MAQITPCNVECIAKLGDFAGEAIAKFRLPSIPQIWVQKKHQAGADPRAFDQREKLAHFGPPRQMPDDSARLFKREKTIERIVKPVVPRQLLC